MPTKPKIFVASSAEARRLAQAVQQELEYMADVTPWYQDAFVVGQNVIDELGRNLRASDFGIFIFAPDDSLRMRARSQKSVRDNVILELGMFIGRLGKERSFIIRPEGKGLRVPTDLLGVVTGKYVDRTDNPRAAVATACTQIVDAIQRQLSAHSRSLDQTVETALETVCRAMSVPVTPERATLRTFIFRRENNELVCRHFWDPNPSEEKVGTTRFPIDRETATEIAVVRCLLDHETRSMHDTRAEGSPVRRLPKGFKGVKGKIKPSIRYVLPAPIWSDDGSIWGGVDFDASSASGKKLLQTEVAKSVMMRLARHLRSLVAAR